jgi:hypothetical protein
MFGLSNANQLFCLNIETNKTAWSAPFSKAAGGDEAAKAAAGQARPERLPSTFVQFVQQDSKNRQPPEGRSRDDSDRGPRRGEGRGRFGGRGGGMGRRGYGSIVDVGPALLGLTPAGELIAYKPAGDAFTELARYKVAERGTYAYPVPSRNGIYIKDQSAVTLWTIE